MSTPTAANKAVVDAAITTVLTGRDLEAIPTYFASGLTQHSTRIAAGIEGLQDFVRAQPDGVVYEPARTFAQDDLVLTHGVYRSQAAPDLVAFELWRLADGKIVEHWDALQPEPARTVSGRTMVDGPTEVTRPEQSAASGALVQRFVQQVLVEGDVSELTDYFDNGRYAQHNPQMGDDLSGLGEALTALAAQGVAMTYTDVHRTIAEGEFVFIQAQGHFGDQATAFYDLFRVEDDKIAEHWDVVFPIQDTLPHDNGLF
ncbi:nuclear transport factor 2 family protein [Streptomyces sp. Act-28]